MTYTVDFNGHLPSFRNWLCTKVGDLSSGKLYPYLQSRTVYACPTDRLELVRKAPPPAPTNTTGRGPFSNRLAPRDYSYSMNCGICHATDLAGFLEPSRTLLYMEPKLSPAD